MRFWTRLLITSIAAMLALTWVLTATSSPAQKSSEAQQFPVSQDKQLQLEYFALRDRVAVGEQLSLDEKERFQLLYDQFGEVRSSRGPLDNQGGPDTFGYFYQDNVAPDTATYNWIELRGDPQATWFSGFTSNDDGYCPTPGNIGFSFSFYGVNYTQFTVTSNGQIEFGTPNASYYWTCLPQPDLGPVIMADMYDAHLDYGGMNGVDVVGYRNFGTYTVIEYDSIGRCCSAGTSNKFEAILYNTGRIKLQYGQQVLNNGTMGSVGIQNAAGDDYLAYRCQTDGNAVRPITDGLAIWFYAEVPARAAVSGHVALDGGSGTVTGVLVQANGYGNPSVHPLANGNYSLDTVQVGNRIIRATLAGYHTDSLAVNVPQGGLPNVNFTLRRLDPPAPTSLTASVNGSTGIVTLDWDNSPDPLVDVYRVYRKLSGDQNWTLRHEVAASADADTLTSPGIWQYAVTAVDNGVVPPGVESARSNVAEIIYGELPPSNLMANGNFDDRIRLNWLSPGLHPSYQLLYDDSSAEAFYVVSFPNEEHDYFAVRFTPPSADTTAYPLLIQTCAIYQQTMDPLTNVWICSDDNGVPNLNTPIMGWQDIGSDAAPGWLIAHADGAVGLDSDADFWVVWQFPAGLSGTGTGSDANAPDGRSYWTWDNTPGVWNQWTAHDWMARVWVGGPPGWGFVMSVGGPSGYTVERVPLAQTAPRRETIKPMSQEKAGLNQIGAPLNVPFSGKQNVMNTGLASMNPFRSTFGERMEPYSQAPALEFEQRRGRNPLDDLDYYKVYRDGSFLAQDAEPPYDDVVGSANENVSHSYYVTAHYDNNQESGPTNTVVGMANMAPGAPSNFTGTPAGNGHMHLTWTDPTVNADATPCVDLAGAHVYRDGTLIGTAGAGIQQFTDTPPDSNAFYTWTVRGIDEVPNDGPASGDYVGAAGTPSYQSNFDLDNGDFVASPDDGWQWGAPGWSGAHSDPNVWGAGLGGTYPNNADWYLTLDTGQPITSASASVDFWINYNVESYFETINFQISVDGGATWEFVNPVGGYPEPAGYNGEPGWSGAAASWAHVILPIGQWAGEAPMFRLHFASDPSVTYQGFLLDDMTIRGMSPPVFATVTGTVTLDGLGGNVTQSVVHANGIGSPLAHPAANGTYTLSNVLVGDRRLVASLAGYHDDTLFVTIPEGGYSGANLTLRRLNPPTPTGLVGSVNSGTGAVALNWDNSTDPQVDVYRVYRKLASDQNWTLIHTRVSSGDSTDVLTVDGIYQYAVTAVDNNVVPPAVESDKTAPITVLFGELPPVMLTANGNFDDRVRLNWLAPGTPPEVEVFYDNGTNSPDIDGIGFWNNVPPYGWLAAHYQGNGAITITRLKFYFTGFATEGDALEVGVFEDNGAGQPTFTPLGVIDATHEAPFDAFRIFEVDPPITIPNGSFFVGARQMTANNCSICLGGDDVTPFINNTFFYAFDTGTWTPFEPGLVAIPMMRAFVIGDMGDEWLEPSPVSAVTSRSSEIGPVAKASSKSGKNVSPALESGSTKVVPLPELAAKEQYSPEDVWSRAGRMFFTVPPHAPYVVTASPNGRPIRSPLDDVTYYRIFRDNVFLANDTIPPYDDVVTSAGENTPHTYWVRSHYDNNQDSDTSNHATGRANMAPAAPTALSGNPVGSTQMQLTWTDPSLNSDGTPCVDLAHLRIYRDGTQIGTVNAGVHQYTDTPPQPDMFYNWTVTAIDEVPNEGPPSVSFIGAVTSPWETTDYDWVEINGNGTNSGLTQDDQNVGPFPLGFDIEYYGQTYSQIYICSNGWASFTSTSTRYFNSCLPDPEEPNTSLDILFDDLYLPSGGSVYYLADAQNDRFIIEWDHVPHISGIGIYTMEIIIGSNGSVIYQYNEVGSQDATVGVEDAGGTDASLQLYCMGDGPFVPANQTAVGFWAGPSGELQGLVRQFGTNAPLEGVRVGIMEGPEFTMTDATGFYSLPLDPGTYSVNYSRQGNCDSTITNILIEDNNATVRNMTLRSPAAQFSVTSVNQGTWPDHDISTTFQITNNGGQCALDFSISDTSAWLSTNPVSGSVPPNQSVDVTVNFTVAGLLPGHDYQSSLRVQHEATGSPYIIPVTLAISEDAPEPVTLPTEYALYQNYPNPFNATTSIRFDVPQESHVKVTLFNVMGQAVATVVDAQYQVGQHSISYDATDLPTGMYLIKMEAGSYTSMKKMMLLK